jgi:hypothetical protein
MPSKVASLLPLVTSASIRDHRKDTCDRKSPRHGRGGRRDHARGDRRCDLHCTRWSDLSYDRAPRIRRGRIARPIDWMHRNLFVTLSAATAAAAFALSGCSHSQPKLGSSATSSAIPPTSSPIIVAAPPTAPLPAPDALIDVLNRLADPNVPGINKVNLVEGATPESAATLDKFTNALRDNGYLPMTFAADKIAWSDKNPSDVMATISVNTPRGNRGAFTFPMEFAPYQGGWQLSRRTAEMLLAVGNSPAPPPSPAPSPTPAPPPSPAPSPTPAPPPSPAPSLAPAPPPTPSPEPAPAPAPAPPPTPSPEPAPAPAPPPEPPPPPAPAPEPAPPPPPEPPPPPAPAPEPAPPQPPPG